MDSQFQKDKEIQRIQRKLLRQETTLDELLNEQYLVEMFRSNHKSLHNFLTLKHFKDMVNYIIILGPSGDKLRSFKYPQVSTQILSSQIPRIFEVMFSPSSEQNNSPTLFTLLLKYFEGTPNDTISGYIIKILTPLYTYEPVKTQQAIMSSGQFFKIARFIYSRSVSEFVVKLIVVESESLLMLYFKQRRELLLEIISAYEKGQQDQVYSMQLVYVLGEVMSKLWNDKHKQLGKMAQTLIKMVEIVLTKHKLYFQEALLYTIISNLVHFPQNSIYLIKIIINRSYKQISICNQETFGTACQDNNLHFGIRKLYMLKCFTQIFTYGLKIIEQMPNVHIYLRNILGLAVKYEWNSMVHVQVETIFRELFKSTNHELYKSIFQKWNMTQYLKEISRKQDKKTVQGYSGMLTNIFTSISKSVADETQFGKYVKSKQPSLLELCDQFAKPKQRLMNLNLGGYKVNFKSSKPMYNQEQLLVVHKQFFQKYHIIQEIQKIQMSPCSVFPVPSQMLDQIQNQNILNSSWALKPSQKI